MAVGLKERENAAANGGTDDFDGIMSNSFSDDEAAQFNDEAGQVDGASAQLDRDLSDKDFDNIIASNFGGASKDKTDAHGDKVKRNYNSDEPSDKNIASVKNKEETGGGAIVSGGGGKSRFSGLLKGRANKLGPSAGVVGVILFAMLGVGGGFFGLASSLLVNIKELLHNDRSDATRTNRIFARGAWANKYNNTDGCQNKKIIIKCKAATLNREQMKQYHDQGFKITGVEIDKENNETGNRVDDGDESNLKEDDKTTRIRIERVKFPDGTVATSGKDFWKHVDSNIEARRWAERASPSRSAFYLNKFFSDLLNRKFNFSKGKKTFPDGEDQNGKKAQDAAFNEQTGGASEEDANSGKLDRAGEELRSDAESETKRKGSEHSKGGAANEVIQAYCSMYQLANKAEALVKAYHMAKLASFALLFFQAADEIKRGIGDGPKSTYLSDNLTHYDSDPQSEKYNLSATDSEGYKIATHGDTAGLKEFSKKYILGGSIGQTVASITSGLASPVRAIGVTGVLGSGSDNQQMRNFCRVAQSNPVVLASACVGTLITAIGLALGTAGGASPIAVVNAAACACVASDMETGDKGLIDGVISNLLGGDVVGAGMAVVSNTGCAALATLAREMGHKLVDEIMKRKGIKDALMSIVRELNVGSDTKGVDAGNAIVAGSQMMLSVAAMGYGLRPAKTDNDNQDVTQYISATQPLQDKYIELAKDDARHDPLDASNEYSLMGTTVRSLNLGAITPDSLYGNLTSLSTVIPTALQTAITGKKVNAAYNQPSTAADGKSGRYDHCDDKDLKDLNNGKGVTPDSFCYIVAVSTTDELNKAAKQAYEPDSKQMNELIDWMYAKQDKPEGDDQGSGTFDNSSGDCANLDGSNDEGCQNSKLASINEKGEPVKDSQYSKYLQYCTDQRTVPLGTQLENYEQGSDRDQRWYSGDQCTYDSLMMKNFRMWTDYCLLIATADGASTCYQEDATPAASSSACANGGNAAIYTCALKYDNYRYLWGGGHSDVPDAKKWIADFNASPPAEWTPILDCSGLVRMAFVEAMGIEDQAYVAPDGYNGSKYWEMIQLKDAKQGDIITEDGHVAIVESNDPAAGEFKIFHASTSGGAQENNILHGAAKYKEVLGAYRAKKG